MRTEAEWDALEAEAAENVAKGVRGIQEIRNARIALAKLFGETPPAPYPDIFHVENQAKIVNGKDNGK